MQFEGMPVGGSRFTIKSGRKHISEKALGWKDVVRVLVDGRVSKIEYGEDGSENVRTHVIEVIEAQVNPKCPECGETL
jgi:hypothetical protein